jgi:hypothetical protein
LFNSFRSSKKSKGKGDASAAEEAAWGEAACSGALSAMADLAKVHATLFEGVLAAPAHQQFLNLLCEALAALSAPMRRYRATLNAALIALHAVSSVVRRPAVHTLAMRVQQLLMMPFDLASRYPGAIELLLQVVCPPGWLLLWLFLCSASRPRARFFSASIHLVTQCISPDPPPPSY